MLYKRLVKLIPLVLCCALMVGCAQGKPGTQSAKATAHARLGVFSWHKEDAADEKLLEEMLGILVQVGASEIYQYMDTKDAPSFLKRAKELGIDVYVLDGEPDWGLDPEARQMLKEVELVAELMAQMGEAGPAGLMLDVEIHLTNVFKDRPEHIMQQYVAALRKTYAYARELGVPLIICIPYFFDTKGYTNELTALIQEASDGAAVMNYQKNDESGQIQTEMEASRSAGKRLIHIYELHEPGLHDLIERNTYYPDGLSAVWGSMDKLQAYFKYDGLSFAFHDYTALREMIARE